MWKPASQPYSDPATQQELQDPSRFAAYVAGARRANSGKPNQHATTEGMYTSYNLPRQPYTWAAADFMLQPNQSSGEPASPQGSEVLAYQAAMVAAMQNKLGGP